MKNKKEIPMWARSGHAKPTNRREFLASGLISMVGMVTLPSVLQLLAPSQVYAQSGGCPAPNGDLCSFIHINLSGGAAMAANFVPMDAGGQPLASYSKMGVLGNIVNEFGGATFSDQSRFLSGLRARASADAINRTAFVGSCLQARDDTSENKLDITGMVSLAGLQGHLLPNIRSGSAGQLPSVVRPPSALAVSGITALTNALGYSSKLTNLKPTQKEKLAKLITNLSAEQTRKLASIGDGKEIDNLVQCAGIKSSELVLVSTDLVDPRKNQALVDAMIWNFGDAATLTSASMIYNGLMKNSGVVSISMGGYDYHDGTRTTGDAADLRAGEFIGRILQSAHVLGKKVFVYVTTDGAVSASENGSGSWASDRGTASASYLIMYDPSGRPQTIGNQIGHYTQGQVADSSFITGKDPERAAMAAFMNYLQYNKNLPLFEKIKATSNNRNLIETSDYDKVLKVAA